MQEKRRSNIISGVDQLAVSNYIYNDVNETIHFWSAITVTGSGSCESWFAGWVNVLGLIDCYWCLTSVMQFARCVDMRSQSKLAAP